MLVADYASVDSNHAPDFAAFKAWGGGAVIVRGAFTFKGQPFADPCIARDRDAIVAAGLAFGAYMIHGWTVDPIAQVKTFRATVGAHLPGDLPVWLDAESSADLATYGLTPEQGLARLELTYDALSQLYPCVGVYTSRRWETEVLHALDSDALAVAPLWVKIPYPYQTGRTAHPEARGQLGELPKPWQRSNGPGAWLKQFQGDAKQVPGFSNQVDLSEWLVFDAANAATDPRTDFVITRLSGHGILARPPNLGIAVETFQRANGLEPDQKIGPKTFAALCG